jgi:hypothetical protein
MSLPVPPSLVLSQDIPNQGCLNRADSDLDSEQAGSAPDALLQAEVGGGSKSLKRPLEGSDAKNSDTISPGPVETCKDDKIVGVSSDKSKDDVMKAALSEKLFLSLVQPAISI